MKWAVTGLVAVPLLFSTLMRLTEVVMEFGRYTQDDMVYERGSDDGCVLISARLASLILVCLTIAANL